MQILDLLTGSPLAQREAVVAPRSSEFLQFADPALPVGARREVVGMLQWATLPSGIRSGVGSFQVVDEQGPAYGTASACEGDTGTHEVGHWLGFSGPVAVGAGITARLSQFNASDQPMQSRLTLIDAVNGAVLATKEPMLRPMTGDFVDWMPPTRAQIIARVEIRGQSGRSNSGAWLQLIESSSGRTGYKVSIDLGPYTLR
jgi:hypothetical protein